MSKGRSGYFKGTIGSKDYFYWKSDEPTAIVWTHISATQDDYGGTKLPKSFVIDVPISELTPDGKMWTHGNATEHMYEALMSIKDSPRLKNSNPDLYTQFVLYDFYKSLGCAIKIGPNLMRTMKVGNWEFAFARARNGQKYPVVKHALFTGFEKGEVII